MTCIDPRDFERPELWLTYEDVRPALRLHFQDGVPLGELAATLGRLGMHGAVAGFAVAVCTLDDLAKEMARPPQTAVALLGRFPAWADDFGRQVNAMLSAWVFERHPEAMRWAKQALDEGQGSDLAAALAERIHFAIDATALLAGRSLQEQHEDFDHRFFKDL